MNRKRRKVSLKICEYIPRKIDQSLRKRIGKLNNGHVASTRSN